MENLSSFIHEELFLIDATQGQATVPDASQARTSTPDVSGFSIGIIAKDANDEDHQLLEKIVGAIGIKPSEVLAGESIDDRIPTWLVFSDSLGFIDDTLPHFGISYVNDTTIITSKSLRSLRNSVEEKGKLWGLLKGHFKS